MSADDGIYILCTEDGYHVRHLMAVESYMWDEEERCESNDPDVWIKNARVMWINCIHHETADHAYAEAREILRKIRENGMWTEYGICEIHIPRNFYPSLEENRQQVIDSLEKCKDCIHWKKTSSPAECQGYVDQVCDRFTSSQDCLNPFPKKLASLISQHQRNEETGLSPDDLAYVICDFIGNLKVVNRMKG